MKNNNFQQKVMKYDKNKGVCVKADREMWTMKPNKQRKIVKLKNMVKITKSRLNKKNDQKGWNLIKVNKS